MGFVVGSKRRWVISVSVTVFIVPTGVRVRSVWGCARRFMLAVISV